MNYKIESIEERGERPEHVATFLRRDELPEGKKEFGQVYIVNMKPKSVKGNHYHQSKNEWIVCIEGNVKVTLKDVKSGETADVEMSADDKPLKRLFIGPGTAHAVANIGDCNAKIVEYSSEQFEPKKDDFLRHKVI